MVCYIARSEWHWILGSMFKWVHLRLRAPVIGALNYSSSKMRHIGTGLELDWCISGKLIPPETLSCIIHHAEFSNGEAWFSCFCGKGYRSFICHLIRGTFQFAASLNVTTLLFNRQFGANWDASQTVWPTILNAMRLRYFQYTLS